MVIPRGESQKLLRGLIAKHFPGKNSKNCSAPLFEVPLFNLSPCLLSKSINKDKTNRILVLSCF
jgi:hypothetical protein